MEEGKFSKVKAYQKNLNWNNFIERNHSLYHREKDIRSEFLRDYNRILHCTAYRRLKHKTQVFFATGHDHICTRIEHVNHVSSVSYTISKFLGLNTELTNAISIGHDLGHAPFGHEGEKIICEITKRDLNETYWHEKNSLRIVDNLETVLDPMGNETNLLLTYAVRDGIISHCGEVNENSIFPREDNLDLYDISKPNQYPPYTWEGCVVKIADKISYLGRDIEDALTLKILSDDKIKELMKMLKETIQIENTINIEDINNAVLIHNFIINLCESSSPENGICFSDGHLQLLNSIKDFNNKNIYCHPKLDYFKNYAKLIINSIYDVLTKFYSSSNIHDALENHRKEYPCLVQSFEEWLIKYSDYYGVHRPIKYTNELIYKLSNKNDYTKAVIDYISGMTDHFAIKIFEELIKFE